MIKFLTSIFFSFLILGTAVSQDDCEFEPSSKGEKMLSKAEDKKKYDSQERLAFYEEVLEDEENCLPCLYNLGRNSFQISKEKGSSYQSAERYLEQLINTCADYHSEAYYILGAINYAGHDYDKAKKYFDYFLNFNSDDPSKFRRDYEKKCGFVKETLPKLDFWKDFYENDVDLDPEKVEGVSSANQELFPLISPDGEIMFYTRRSKKQAKGDIVAKDVEELTWSRREDINQRFDQGEPLPKPFNLGSSYGAATISINNKEMFVAVKNPVGKNPDNYDIFRTSYEFIYDKEEGKKVYKWSELELLGPEVNTESGWESQPSLSADGNTLFFATVRAETTPNRNGDPSHDIYFSTRDSSGNWSQAKSIGKNINTPGAEKSPFMHSDSKTLYFASNGHLGAGGMDVFYTKMDDSGNWSDPKNIGHPVNTPEDETGLIVSTDGETAYFFSKRIKGSGGYDIYSFTLPEKARPEKVMILKGELKDENKEPVKNAKIEIKYADSKEITEIDVAEDDGRYAAVVNLETADDVILSVKKEGTVFNSHVIAKKEDKEKPVVVKVNLETRKIEKNKPFIINDIFYETNSAEIDSESKLILQAFADYLKDNPTMYIEIRGHTDNLGSDKDNLALSMDRAFEVKGFIEKNGIDGKRVKAIGYGEQKPVGSNDSEEGRAKNRRTEFVITKL